MVLKKLTQIIQSQSDQTYFVDVAGQAELTYQDLEKLSLGIAESLSSKVQRGEYVSMMVDSPMLYIPTILACWRLGVVPAILEPYLSYKRYKRFTNSFQSKVLLTDQILDVEFDQECQFRVDKISNQVEGIDKLEFLITVDEPCLLMFSSGSTGVPKCIPLSLKHIDHNISAMSQILEINKNDTFFSTSPIYFNHGLYNSCLTALLLGGKVVYGGILNVTNAHHSLMAAKLHSATIYHFTPSMVEILALIGSRIKETLPRFRFMISGTSKLNIDGVNKLKGIFNIPIYQQYGMTEMLFIALNVEGPRIKQEGNVGAPVACQIKILDSKGVELKRMLIGEIWVYSEFALKIYLNQPNETQNNWFVTGDLGYVNMSGDLVITGRIKDIIKKGGISINPNEINDILLEYETILESVVIGIPDTHYGEEIFAFVISSNATNEATLLNHIKQFLPSSHIPKKVVFCNSFKKDPHGKIKTYELKKMMTIA
jgi:acyl-coenzyme A synthetase/AMP-(fatty) acid ligase